MARLSRSKDAPENTYSVFKSSRQGRIVELFIPLDAVKNTGETPAAFHQRVAIGERVIASETRTSSACCRRETAPTQTAEPACTGQGSCSPCQAQHQQK